MANLLIVTDQTSDWQQYFPSEQVVNVAQYLATQSAQCTGC